MKVNILVLVADDISNHTQWCKQKEEGYSALFTREVTLDSLF